MKRNADSTLKNKLQNLFDDFVLARGMDIKLSFIAPMGYETSNGTFDICEHMLFLNFEHIKNKPEYEIVFCLFHELRHAEQYLFPEKFGSEIQKSIKYVVLYNGTCYKLLDKKWGECKMNANEWDFVQVYKSLPYELDANEFAYNETAKLFGNEDIKKIYENTLSFPKIDYQDLKKIFKSIDEKIKESR